MLFYNGDHVSSILCKKIVYLIHHVTCGSWMFNLFCILDFLGAFGLIPQFLSRILEIPYDILLLWLSCGSLLWLSCGRPVNVVCWRRAICLEFMEKVRAM